MPDRPSTRHFDGGTILGYLEQPLPRADDTLGCPLFPTLTTAVGQLVR